MLFLRVRKPDHSASKITPIFLPRSIAIALAAILLVILGVLAWLAVWLGIPAWYIRLAGTQASGTAQIIASCGADDYATQGDNAQTFQYAFRFTDARGQTHRLTSHSACNNLYGDGEKITIWYVPNNLNSFVTSAEAFWLYILSPIWAVVVGVVSYFFWWAIKPYVLPGLRRFTAWS